MCESGDNMRREEFLSACRRTEVSYRDSLLNFYKKYVDIVEKLYNKYIMLDENNQNRMLIMKLKEWLEQSAYNDILFTINSLNEDSEQKVLGFINLYDYILETANDDYELIDQLFFIPGRFEKDFNVINNRVILNDDDEQYNFYNGNEKESFDKILFLYFMFIPKEEERWNLTKL